MEEIHIDKPSGFMVNQLFVKFINKVIPTVPRDLNLIVM